MCIRDSTNTSVYGYVEPKPDMKKAGFELYLDDDRLEEKVKVKHTWFVHVPSGVKDGTDVYKRQILYCGLIHWLYHPFCQKDCGCP